MDLILFEARERTIFWHARRVRSREGRSKKIAIAEEPVAWKAEGFVEGSENVESLAEMSSADSCAGRLRLPSVVGGSFAVPLVVAIRAEEEEVLLAPSGPAK